MNAEESIKDYIVLKEYHSKFGEGLRGIDMNTNEPCAAVFPVDEDFMRLPNNDVIQLEGRQQKITYYLTLGGWNISSPNHIINVIDKFDFSQLDVLVLVNSYHFLEHRVIEDIIRIAKTE